MSSLRHNALQILLERDQNKKVVQARMLDLLSPIDPNEVLIEPAGIPGRPNRPKLFEKLQFKKKPLTTIEGRAVLIHTLAHIELNAVDLALDIVWRFSGMPDDFYRQWASIANEEAYHFQLLRDHLRSMNYDYGDFPAHNGLWVMGYGRKNQT